MVDKPKSKKGAQLIVPEIFVKGINKSKISIECVTLEGMITLGNKLDIQAKEIFLSYVIILITLVYGSQARLGAKLIVQRKTDNSAEKVFQCTEAHAKFTKILSNSNSSKLLLGLYSIIKAIKHKYYGITEEERTSDEVFLDAIQADLYELIRSKGQASSKVMVRDKDTRVLWLRASCSSLRSKWCSIPTFTPSKIATPGMPLKTLNISIIHQFITNLGNALVEEGLIAKDDIPTIDDIKGKLAEEISLLRIDIYIDDDVHGTFAPINIEPIFGFQRISKGDVAEISTPLPPIADQFKNLL